MAELLATYWPIILVALVIGLIAGIIALRPRQRVRLTGETPVRPHMAAAPRRETTLEHEAKVTTSHVLGAGEPAAGGSDDIELLKGVGPKLAAILAARGLTSFAQIAKLTPQELDRLDEELGAFRGRLARDRVVEQADLLARGDRDGFEQRFGKL